jgi:hypothetical protein
MTTRAVSQDRRLGSVVGIGIQVFDPRKFNTRFSLLFVKELRISPSTDIPQMPIFVYHSRLEQQALRHSGGKYLAKLFWKQIF